MPISGNLDDRDQQMSDGIENYDVLEQIGNGSTATVYVALCKRGRLRNRKIALKKTPRIQVFHQDERSTSSVALYLSLHHPTIVSLHSVFSTPHAEYQVLELCSHGTLHCYLQSRHPSFFTENEVRGIAKSLVDALLYLNQESVVHGDIRTENVLLTNDYRVKLSGFGSASRVSGTTLMNHDPSFSADLYSLGRLIFTCLSSGPSLSKDDVFIMRDLPSSNLSQQAQSLISDLLADPSKRIALHSIPFHDFFDSSLPIQPLSAPSSSNGKENDLYPLSTNRASKTSEPVDRVPLQLRTNRVRPTPTPTTKPVGYEKPHFPLKDALEELVVKKMGPNAQLRDILRVDVPARRIVSDPARGIIPDPPTRRAVSISTEFASLASLSRPRRMFSSSATPSLVADSATPSPSLTALSKEQPSLVSKPVVRRQPLKPLHINLEDDSPCVQPRENIATTAASVIPVPSIPTAKLPEPSPDIPAAPRSATPTPHIVSSRPTPFTAYLLTPQTIKLLGGQVMILPSLAVLVDLREGERRKHRKGDEVFVVDREGLEVKVYSAPHLSTPCCLIEPSAIYTLNTLPQSYWKRYSAAKRAVEQIKQKTPQLVMWTPEARCTLMANGPHADIEILSPPPSSVHAQTQPTTKGAPQQATMRIRLSRRQDSPEVEIARYVPMQSCEGGEWTKKTMQWKTVGAGGLPFADVGVEGKGMASLVQFLRICETVETMPQAAARSPKTDSVTEKPYSPSTTAKFASTAVPVVIKAEGLVLEQSQKSAMIAQDSDAKFLASTVESFAPPPGANTTSSRHLSIMTAEHTPGLL
ncbi:hypothetical protein PLICRDRAFT_57606 [Plicaturopsis crispa FD-325 SS-3]|uniref:Uncharacterized protein n=1 Tax=Plicaturopsis crispa FD-325 SS-3 TaxID=944288 RepID=A0A0C9SXV7_PLICR|nr:hypothetical protein PLICRDRAFT_57606 [Plicaturopsis crispa FD-325 SS-3]